MKTKLIFAAILFNALLCKSQGTNNDPILYNSVNLKEGETPWIEIKNNLPVLEYPGQLISDGKVFYTIFSRMPSSAGATFFVSNDNCKSWQAITDGFPSLNGDSPSLAANGNKLILGTQSKIYSCENIGEAWKNAESIPEHKAANQVQLSNGKTTSVAGIGSELFLSKDNGVTWNEIKCELKKGWDMIESVATNDSMIIMGGISPTYDSLNHLTGIGNFLLLTENDGMSWQNLQQNLPLFQSLTSTSLFIIGPDIFMDTKFGLFISTDKGLSWHTGNGFPGQLPDGTTEHLLSRTNSSTVVESGSILFYGNSQGVFLSFDNGENWTEADAKDLRNGVNSLIISGPDIFAFTHGNKIWSANVKELELFARRSKK
ncbi:MAG: sialidase family protein [Bacteroidota bacterium]